MMFLCEKRIIELGCAKAASRGDRARRRRRIAGHAMVHIVTDRNISWCLGDNGEVDYDRVVDYVGSPPRSRARKILDFFDLATPLVL